jgi:hypothetical protein
MEQQCVLVVARTHRFEFLVDGVLLLDIVLRLLADWQNRYVCLERLEPVVFAREIAHLLHLPKFGLTFHLFLIFFLFWVCPIHINCPEDFPVSISYCSVI